MELGNGAPTTFLERRLGHYAAAFGAAFGAALGVAFACGMLTAGAPAGLLRHPRTLDALAL